MEQTKKSKAEYLKQYRAKRKALGIPANKPEKAKEALKRMESKTKRILLRVSPDVYSKIEALAKSSNNIVSDYVENLLENLS